MVVIIDDDDSFRNGLAEHLRDDGHAVTEYASPAALPPLDSMHAPALLITDYEMPGEDGLQLAKRFHEAHPDVPVVIVTARWTEYLDAQVAAGDFLRLIRKPLDYDLFHRTLHEITGPSPR